METTQVITPQIIRSRRNQERNGEGNGNVQAIEMQHMAHPDKLANMHETTAIHESFGTLALVPENELFGYFSTSALILNKVFGTGIFTTPLVVLALTGSKCTALMLWLLGSLVTWSGVIVYLEYGIRFPLNGGELYYIDFVWRKPRMLMAYIYSFPFLTFSGTIATSLSFGKAIIISATPSGAYIDPRLQKFFAVLVIGTVCLLHGLSRVSYVRFNNIFAIYKIFLLSFLTITGWCVLGGQRTASAAKLGGSYGIANLRPDFDQAMYHPYNFAVALLNIQRAFLGYENANYVLEEVRRGKPGDESAVYRRAAKFTVLMVTFFYMMINVAFFAVSDTEELMQAPDTLTLFFERVFGPSGKARRASGAIQAISAFGNIMSYIYSNVRVKQEIARSGITPMPQYFASTNSKGAPEPALILTFVVTSIVVLAAPLSDANGSLIIYTLFPYTRTFISILLGLGLLAAPFLDSFAFEGRPWRPKSSIGGFKVLVPMILLYLATNLFILGISWWPVNSETLLQSGKPSAPVLPSITGPAIGTGLLVGGAIYWFWDLIILKALGWTWVIEESEPEDGEVRMKVWRDLDGPAWKAYSWFVSCCESYQRVRDNVQERWRYVSRHL